MNAIVILMAMAAGQQVQKNVADSVVRIARETDPAALENRVREAMRQADAPGTTLEDTRIVREMIVHALNENKARRLASLGAAAASKPFKALDRLKRDLNARRQAALEFVNDEKLYPYKDDARYDRGNKESGQKRVDELVAEVKKAWSAPLRHSTAKEIRADLQLVRTIDGKLLPDLEAAPEEGAMSDVGLILWNEGRPLTVRSFALSEEEAETYQWNRRVEKHNADLKDPEVGQEVKEHVRTVNEYREMLGLRQLFIDPRLCRASRKHSAVCDKAGDIWHDGTDGTPQSRAEAEGFRGPVGENVANGYSRPADFWWRCWYQSSGHHRNGVNAPYRCMGYGRHNTTATEMFSTAEPSGAK